MIYHVTITSDDTVVHVSVRSIADVCRLVKDFGVFSSIYVSCSDF